MCVHIQNSSNEKKYDPRNEYWQWYCQEANIDWTEKIGFKFQFLPVPNEDNVYRIYNGLNVCAHIRDPGADSHPNSLENRAPLWTWGCELGQTFKFRIHEVGDSVVFQSVHSGKCLHVKSASKDIRAPLWQWDCQDISKVPDHMRFQLFEGTRASHDLLAEDWCWDLDIATTPGSEDALLIYAVVKNEGISRFVGAQMGRYTIGIGHGGTYEVSGVIPPGWSIEVGQSEVLETHLRVPYGPGISYRSIGDWVFRHPQDELDDNNRFHARGNLTYATDIPSQFADKACDARR
jgi:hypothetical protein